VARFNGSRCSMHSNLDSLSLVHTRQLQSLKTATLQCLVYNYCRR